MEAGSEEESNKVNGNGLSEAPKKPKRKMKTPFQLEILERTYASETYPSEVTRAELSEKLGLTDRQLQMWFCHRRLKDKKESVAKSLRTPEAVERRGLDSGKEELMAMDPGSDHGSRSGSDSGSGSGSGSRSSQYDYVDDVPLVPKRYYELPQVVMERRVIACIEAQLGEPIREDGPILGVEFDELPPGAFGAPIVMSEHQERSGHTYDGGVFERYDAKKIKVPVNALREPVDSIIRSDGYGVAPSRLYDSPVDGPGSISLPFMQGNGQLSSKGHGIPVQASNVSITSEQMKQERFSSPPRDNDNILHNENVLQTDRKRKIDETRKEVQANEKKIRKEIEKQEVLRRKREEQMRKEMEKQYRERRKEEERMLRKKQQQEERFEREERRELERREKFMKKELLRAERRKQKEELRREKEAIRMKAALEKATARRIAKESMELIEDERLELMELATTSKGLTSIISLDYDTLQNLESFRDALCTFPPQSVKLKKPFSDQPWIESDKNIGNLLMVWRFCITFADVLGLWPFTLDELVQAFHDYESRLFGEIHIAFIRLIIKDIADVARIPVGGSGTNQYTVAGPDGGHPQIVEGAFLWGFSIHSWKCHLNPLTWPEILRQLALSAGFGPQLKKKSTEKACLLDDDEGKGCEDIISTLRNGSAAENAIARMQEKGFPNQRRSRHRLTPGTVKFAAYHVLSLEGSKGLNVVDLAEKIQKSGLRDLTTSKTPEASISVALSRDPILFERTAPSTYCVRPAFRKDPADADAILSAAREKMQKYVNGFLAGENGGEVERDDDSDVDDEGPEVDESETPSSANQIINNVNEIITCSVNDKDDLSNNALYLQNELESAGIASNLNQEETDIDESKSGEPWVQGLMEGEYSNLSVEERLNALVALVGLANEGNSIRAILEDRLDAANCLKKQMWAEAQLDKRKFKEASITKFNDSSLVVAAEGSQSPLTAVDNKNHEASGSPPVKEEPNLGADSVQNLITGVPGEKSSPVNDPKNQITSLAQQNGHPPERSRLQLKSFICHRAEETYVYRSLPLGQDRRRNRYWQFVASACRHDPGSGRIFVESPDGNWRLIDSKEAFDALLTSLDTCGIRESHLHIMLQKAEKTFKENVKRRTRSANLLDQRENAVVNEIGEMSSSPACTVGSESPISAICGSNSETLDLSTSFAIELGRNETERKNALKRYLDLQIWMWKECFNSSTLCALAYGKRRCLPLLGFCDSCLFSYIFEENLCPSCHKEFGSTDNKLNLFDQVIQCGERSKINLNNLCTTYSSHPPRITLLKALLTFVELSIPSEGLQLSWSERQRKSWGSRLHNLSSMEDLLEILTQFECAIKREFLSSNFETTEELLDSFFSSGTSISDSVYPRSVPQLPWIPQTTAAVTLRLLELDASISYLPDQKIESQTEKEVEDTTKIQPTCVRMKNIGKLESAKVSRAEHMEEGSSNHLQNTKVRQVVRGRGGGRPRGRCLKKIANSILGSGRQNARGGDMLSQVLLQQGQRAHVQKHARGRRTVRQRRTENKAVEKAPLGCVGGKGYPRGLEESPTNFVGEEWYGDENAQLQVDEDDDSNSVDAIDSDDNANGNSIYEYEKLHPSFEDADYNRSSKDVNEVSNEDMDGMYDDVDNDEDENLGGAVGYEREDEILDGDVDINNGSDENDERNEDESSDSMVSGDYDD